MKAEEHRRLANKAMNLLFDTKARLAQALDDLENELEEIDRGNWTEHQKRDDCGLCATAELTRQIRLKDNT